MIINSSILIVIGFFLLIKGADFLVSGASNIAKKFHISEIIIGLTVVSIGTTMPELMVSIKSAISGYSDMAIGNVIGSNISNLLLILGIAAVLQPVMLKKETRLIDIPICLIVTIVFYFICNYNQNITRTDGFILIGLFVLFIIYTIVMSIKGKQFNDEDIKEEKKEKKEKINYSTPKSIIYILLGIVALKFGGDLVVDNAVKIAQWFNLQEKVISVTILAIGTSLPELVTIISAAVKKESDIAIGNLLGSNIFNMLLITGISAIIKPITYNINYNIDMFIVIFATSILFLFPYIPPKNQVSRMNGFIYILLYITYMIILFI